VILSLIILKNSKTFGLGLNVWFSSMCKLIFPIIGKFIGVKFYNKLKLKKCEGRAIKCTKEAQICRHPSIAFGAQRDVITFHMTHPMP
jgi:hypothetical protein